MVTVEFEHTSIELMFFIVNNDDLEYDANIVKNVVQFDLLFNI